MDDILTLINECNNIRYPSYRTAQKLQILQHELKMQFIRLDLIAGVFKCHRLSVTENLLTLDIYEIEDVVSDIYFAAAKDLKNKFSVNVTTKLCLSYICKLFNGQNNISVISLKIILVLLCYGKLENKYDYFHQELADHNSCLSRLSLHTLLVNMCKVIEMIGESVSFGNHLIQSSIDDCFKESPGCLGISEAQFASWLREEPHFLIWFSTFNRLSFAENIIHNVKCSTCATMPLKGPRYACLRCSDYNQCQSCFFLGKTSNKHKIKHSMREYCTLSSDKDGSKVSMKLLRNKFKSCIAESITAQPEEISLKIKKDMINNKSEDGCALFKLYDPQNELQSIINQLEKQNTELRNELADITHKKAERIQHYRSAIEAQLERLKELKKCLFTQSEHIIDLNIIQSTPMIRPFSSRVRPLPLPFELSPIINHSASETESTKNNNNIHGSCINGTTSKDIYSATNLILNNTGDINLSTWLGGGEKTRMESSNSNFTQWIETEGKNCVEQSENAAKSVNHNWFTAAMSQKHKSCNNAVSSLQHSVKHSHNSSLQNVQGDLKDILDRLQNMVTNDESNESQNENKNNSELDATCFI